MTNFMIVQNNITTIININLEMKENIIMLTIECTYISSTSETRPHMLFICTLSPFHFITLFLSAGPAYILCLGGGQVHIEEKGKTDPCL